MIELFLAILNMSLISSFVALVVILSRHLLKKAPKVFSYALWSLVLFRLLCPVSFESPFSLIPMNTEIISENIMYSKTPEITTGLGTIDQTVNTIIQSSLAPANPIASVNPMGVVIEIGAMIWVAGMVLLLSYGLFTYFSFKHKLSTATWVRDTIYETDRIKTPFVIGLVKPRILIPTNLSKNEWVYVIAHEQTHIKRFDYLIKPIALLALVIHWFNPIIWVSYFLMVKDMEMSCDETVLKHSGEDIRGIYSNSLLSFSVKQSGLFIPIAFGESNIKSRIKNILKYKKTKFWIIVAASLLVIAISVGLMGNPKADTPNNVTPLEAISDTTEPILTVTETNVASTETELPPVETKIETEFVILKLGEKGKVLQTIPLYSEEDVTFAQNMIFNYLIRSAAWPGLDPDSLDACYVIRQTYIEANETHDYYAYLVDGKSVMQNGKEGLYSFIDDVLYEELAARFEE